MPSTCGVSKYREGVYPGTEVSILGRLSKSRDRDSRRDIGDFSCNDP